MLQQTVEETNESRRRGELARVSDLSSFADPDSALVEALKSRTAGAFDDLVKQYGHRLLNVAMRITRNREDAEDVVQDSFLKVFKNIDGFRGSSKFSTWLTRIVINQALMLIRGNSQKFVPIHEGVDFGGEIKDRFDMRESAAGGYTPEQFYALRELEGAALNLRNVRKSSRGVMELHVKYDLTEVEISEALTISLSAVKARLYRGRQDLREAMRKHFPSTQLVRAIQNASPANLQEPNPLAPERQPSFTSASGLAPDSLLPNQCDRSSFQVECTLPYQVDPQLLTQPSHSSDGRPPNCF